MIKAQESNNASAFSLSGICHDMHIRKYCSNSINKVLDAIMEPKLVQLYNFQNAIVSIQLLLKFEIDLESTFIPNSLLGGVIRNYNCYI